MKKEKSEQSAGTRKILAIALPLVFQQLCLQLQVYIDRAMLGHVDSDYFSAIGNVLVPYYMVTSIIAAACMGTTILIAQNVGAKNEAQCKGYAECSFIGNSLFPLAAFIFFFFFSDPMFRLMGVQSPVLEYGTVYLKILSFSLLILGISSTVTSIIQGVGITKVIMYAGIISNGINILLDWILIYGRFGFPQMGIEGAALATVIANFITSVILICCIFMGRKIPFSLEVKNIFHFDWSLYKKVLQVGLPSGIESALWNIGNLVVVSLLNRLDDVSVGVYTLVFSLEVFPLILYMGFANAALTLVGHKTGQQENKQAVEVGFKCLRFSLFFCIIAAIMFVVFPQEILSLFTGDKSYVDYATPFLAIVSIIIFPKAINNVIGLGIRGMGDTGWMLYGQIGGTLIVITLSYLFIFTLELGLLGVFIAFLIDETVRSVINLLRFWKGREIFLLKPF